MLSNFILPELIKSHSNKDTVTKKPGTSARGNADVYRWTNRFVEWLGQLGCIEIIGCCIAPKRMEANMEMAEVMDFKDPGIATCVYVF